MLDFLIDYPTDGLGDSPNLSKSLCYPDKKRSSSIVKVTQNRNHQP
jgi:hypothetical protein